MAKLIRPLSQFLLFACVTLIDCPAQEPYRVEDVKISPVASLEDAGSGVSAIIVYPSRIRGFYLESIRRALENILPIREVKEVAANMPEGMALLRKHGGMELPLIFLDKTVEISRSFSQLMKGRSLVKSSGGYLLRHAGIPRVYPKRKLLPEDLNVFIRLDCPHSIWTQAVLINAVERKLIPETTKIRFRYTLDTASDTDFSRALSSPTWETQESLRQLVIQRDWSSSYRRYVLERLRSGFEASWEEAAKMVGIPQDKLEKTISQVGRMLLTRDRQEARTLRAELCPSFLWQNNELFTDAKDLLQLSPFSTLSSVQFAIH